MGRRRVHRGAFRAGDGLSLVREVNGVSAAIYNLQILWAINAAYDMAVGRSGNNVFFSVVRVSNSTPRQFRRYDVYKRPDRHLRGQSNFAVRESGSHDDARAVHNSASQRGCRRDDVAGAPRLSLGRVFEVGVAVQPFFVEAQQFAGFFIAEPAFAQRGFDVAPVLLEQRL